MGAMADGFFRTMMPRAPMAHLSIEGGFSKPSRGAIQGKEDLRCFAGGGKTWQVEEEVELSTFPTGIGPIEHNDHPGANQVCVSTHR